MAGKFRFPHQYWLVDVCPGGSVGDYNCFNNLEFPGNKSSGGKPGKKFENGVGPLNPPMGDLEKPQNKCGQANIF